MNFGYQQLYVNGTLCDSANQGRMPVVCPANGKTIAEVAEATAADTHKALEAAQKGFAYWSRLTLNERTIWMMKLRQAVLDHQEELRMAIVYEMGKTYEGSLEDIEAVVNGLEWYPAAMKTMHDEQIPDYEGTHRHRLVRRPAGVVVAYLAWNFPLLNVGFKLGPALASGCSLIIKPSSLSPLSAYLLGKILDEIKFPAGVVNVLTGPTSQVADVLSSSTIPATITMIGSTATGQKVIAASATSIKRLSMELGGNAPFIVFEDADFEEALNIGIAIKYGNCGQICVAANRFLVHESLYERFVEAFAKRAAMLKPGFGRDEHADMGPLVTRYDRDRMLELVTDALEKGGILKTGGKIPEGKIEGNWFEPTVIANMATEMRLFKEETFGPIAPFMAFSTDDQALELANKTEYGLASYIFTNNHHRIDRFSEELEFGEVQINGLKYSIYLPHGGIKNSGLGFDCSHLALHDYLITKRITSTIKK